MKLNLEKYFTAGKAYQNIIKLCPVVSEIQLAPNFNIVLAAMFFFQVLAAIFEIIEFHTCETFNIV
jgi:hypothetical protein